MPLNIFRLLYDLGIDWFVRILRPLRFQFRMTLIRDLSQLQAALKLPDQQFSPQTAGLSPLRKFRVQIRRWLRAGRIFLP